MNKQQQATWHFDAGLISLGMVLSIVGALILACGMAVKQLIDASRLPVLKLVKSRAVPELPLASVFAGAASDISFLGASGSLTTWATSYFAVEAPPVY